MSLILGLDPGLATFGVAVLRVTQYTDFPDMHQCVGMHVFTSEPRKGEGVRDGNVRRADELAAWLGLILAGRRPIGEGVQSLFPNDMITMLCAEAFSQPRSATAAAKVAMAWGVILAERRRRNLKLVQMSPQAVKDSVVGTKDASKKHVEKVLLRIYGREIRYHLRDVKRGLHEHAYDALAVAHACRTQRP